MTLDPDSFRSVLGRFASGVTVLTARDHAGQDRGMTVSSFCSLSLRPPLVLACIDIRAETYEFLSLGAHVVVNILSMHQEVLSRRFAELANAFSMARGASTALVFREVPMAW